MQPTANKIVSKEKVVNLAISWRQEGHKVVFTNGCFDIVHLGHIDYLEKARRLGSKLVLGLNTDKSVSRLKGPMRPVVNEYARARLLAAMEFVDSVVLFDEETPLCLIEAIKPDILVKGNDYTIDKIVGADFVINNGGSVQTVDLVEGFSTSSLIEKIKNQL